MVCVKHLVVNNLILHIMDGSLGNARSVDVPFSYGIAIGAA